MKEKLRDIIESNSSKSGQYFDTLILTLIFLSLIIFSIETLQGISTIAKSTLHYIEIFCVVLFTIEYILRIYDAKKPLKYLFSFYAVIDLIAIVPFYLKNTVDLKTVPASLLATSLSKA
ncbi:MAG: ion transporter [Cyclobacteriaceae bacterium]|nr:ion transporter [Cyclobacteriaceae bacterium]